MFGCFAFLVVVAGAELASLLPQSNVASSRRDSRVPIEGPAELRAGFDLQPRLIVVFLVGSREKAYDIMSAVRKQRADSDAPHTIFFAFKVSTPEEEASVRALAEAWEGNEMTGVAETWRPSSVMILDLRYLASID
jgi:hypothetical protein